MSNIQNLIESYLQDPNCSPYDWISCEKVTTEEKRQFESDVRVKNAHKRSMQLAWGSGQYNPNWHEQYLAELNNCPVF